MSIKRQDSIIKKYNHTGYIKIKKTIPVNLINQIKKDLIKKNLDNIYYDSNGIIRRSENIYNKSSNLKKLNQIIKKKILYFKKKLVIFKDKCNFGLQVGMVFAHYDGIFYF